MHDWEKDLLTILNVQVKDRTQGQLSENIFWTNLLQQTRVNYVPHMDSDSAIVDAAHHFGKAERTFYYPDLAIESPSAEIGFATQATNRVADTNLTKSVLYDLKFPNTMVTMRHSFYMQYLSKTIRDEPKAILEIGGGAGLLMSMLALKFKPTLVVQIDIPEMLVQFAATFKTRFADVFEFHVNTFPKKISTGRHLVLLENGKIENFLPRLIDMDLTVNTHSLQEMSLGARNFAIFLMENSLRKGGYFFNVNWIQEHMDNVLESYYNNPLEYPYNQRFQCIDFREDPFQSVMRSLGIKSKSPSLAFLRLARKY